VADDEANPAPRLSGRRSEAIANDARILAAARALLTVAPATTMAEIAGHAGVGIGSLYRRFPSKDALAYRLCRDGMEAISAAARDGLAAIDDDPWGAFVSFIDAAMNAGAGSLRGLVGTFVTDEELNRVAAQMGALIQEMVEAAQARGAVREDITGNDVGIFFEMLRVVRIGDDIRSNALRRRYIEMLTPALSAPAASALSVPPASWSEIRAAWNS
jgi:AcrR family transcriptional regulator